MQRYKRKVKSHEASLKVGEEDAQVMTKGFCPGTDRDVLGCISSRD